jgi:putative peptidoglycan lipid II flippase
MPAIQSSEARSATPHNEADQETSDRGTSPSTANGRPTTPVARAAALLLVATLLSRVLGLARDVLVSKYFGVSQFTDAYKAAFTLPDLFFFLIAGGALTSATVPVFSHYLERGEEEEAWKVFSVFMGAIALAVAVVIAAGMLWMGPLLTVIVPGFRGDAAQMALTVRLTRIVFPAQIFFFAGGLMMSALYVRNRFLLPALGPIVYNLGIIAGGAVGAWRLGPHAGVEGLCWGVLGGALVGNVGIQVIALRRAGIRFRPCWELGHPGVRRAARLVLPVMLGLSLTCLHAVLTRPFGSFLPVGSITWLDNANKVMQLPMSLFAHALGTALFPAFAALAARGDLPGLRRQLRRGMQAIFFATVPLSLLMPVLAEPLVRLLFQWGRFTPADTHATAAATAYYSLALFAHCGSGIATRAFYAVQATAEPVVMGLLSTAVYIALNLALMGPMGANGLALSMSIAAGVNLLGLLLLLERRLGDTALDMMGASCARMALASVAGAAAAWLVVQVVGGSGDLTAARAVLQIGAGSAVAASVYLGVAARLGLREVAWVSAAVQRAVPGQGTNSILVRSRRSSGSDSGR